MIVLFCLFMWSAGNCSITESLQELISHRSIKWFVLCQFSTLKAQILFTGSPHHTCIEYIYSDLIVCSIYSQSAVKLPYNLMQKSGICTFLRKMSRKYKRKCVPIVFGGCFRVKIEFETFIFFFIL